MSVKPECTISLCDDHEWNALLMQFPDRTVFHSLAWLQVLCEAHHLRRLLLRADIDGRCVGVWPCLELHKGPFRILGSPLPGWSTAYLGPLLANDADPTQILGACFEHRAMRRWSYFRCRVWDEHRTIDLEPLGFSRLAREETYQLDLGASEESLWNNLKSECRTRIRKAEKDGLEFRIETDDSFLDDFWRMSCEVYAKSNLKPPFNHAFVELMLQRLVPAGLLRVYSAMHNGRRIATLVLPHNDHTMYYWAGGTYQEFRDIPSNNLLHWRALLEAKRMGLGSYDFISTVGGPGRFKRTFGPQARLVGTHWEASRHRIIGALKNRYEHFLRPPD